MIAPNVNCFHGIMQPMNPVEAHVIRNDIYDPVTAIDAPQTGVTGLSGVTDAMNALSFVNLLFPK